jgi:16S rRNA (cytosine1402-N4)-methyltransferase
MLKRRSTPAGQHRPVLLKEVLEVLDPQARAVVVDCTVGWAGHAAELLARVGAQGKLIGFDFDADNLVKARERLEPIGYPFSLHHGNFAGLANVLAAEGITEVELLLADLGMSSMQVDDAERGFSYVRDGPLDMRMDRSRGKTAAQLLATISEMDLRAALQDYGDEPEADKIAKAIVAARERTSILRTGDLAKIIVEATRNGKPEEQWRLHPAKDKWNIHPAARTFQALRILVNRELANLGQLLRVLPTILKSGGRAAIISFHSGEDRLVKAAFREGHRAGVYGTISQDPIRASFAERTSNPRSRSAKVRWVEKLSKGVAESY